LEVEAGEVVDVWCQLSADLLLDHSGFCWDVEACDEPVHFCLIQRLRRDTYFCCGRWKRAFNASKCHAVRGQLLKRYVV
jgi:hypothetical protein